MSHRVPLSQCPACGKKLTGAGTFEISDDLAPQPGDVSLCMYCANLMVFGDDLTLRAPTAQETAALMADDEIRRRQQFIRDFNRREGTT